MANQDTLIDKSARLQADIEAGDCQGATRRLYKWVSMNEVTYFEFCWLLSSYQEAFPVETK